MAGFGAKLTLEDVFMLGKVRLEVPLLPSEDALLTLQKLESHIGGTKVTADADEVGGLSTTTIDDLLFASSPQTGDAEAEAREACRGISPNQVDPVAATCKANTSIQLLEILHSEASRDPNRAGELLWMSVHRVDIREAPDSSLIA